MIGAKVTPGCEIMCDCMASHYKHNWLSLFKDDMRYLFR